MTRVGLSTDTRELGVDPHESFAAVLDIMHVFDSRKLDPMTAAATLAKAQEELWEITGILAVTPKVREALAEASFAGKER